MGSEDTLRKLALAFVDGGADDQAFIDLLESREVSELFAEVNEEARREEARRSERFSAGDLKCAREALALTINDLSRYLPWLSPRISESETGKREVKLWTMERIAALEALARELEEKLYHEGIDGRREFTVWATDEAYRIANPAEVQLPAAVHRVAATRAASRVGAETGLRPRIVVKEKEKKF